MRDFGETIRDLRTAQDLGLRETATNVGISPAYLSRIERGKERPPSADVIKSLATALAADPDVLFRLSSSTDPKISGYLKNQPGMLPFLRLLMEQEISSEELEKLHAFASEMFRSRA